MRSALLVMIVVACGPPPAPHRPSSPAGNVHRTIVTSSPEAQRHFDVGLAHAYGFNFDAAKIELEAALAADPQCAMCEWGIAYSSGANINERDKRWPGALEAAQKARSLAKDPVERALADALVVRYSSAGDDRGYAEAMRALAAKHTDDDDLAILFAEAAMLTLPIGTPYWPHPSPLIVEAQSVLERVLARAPDHIGAIHFYIHLMEDSADRAKAIPYADKLARLAPGAGHLIHMASHLYLRVGRYADAEDANRQAIAADAELVKHLPADATYTKFAMHPKHFLWQTLLWQGERSEARKLVEELAPHFQHMAMSNPHPLGLDTMVRAFTAVRFSDWDDVLAIEVPTLPAGALATHYARGLAFVAKHQLEDARRESEWLQTATLDSAPEAYRKRLVDVARIARLQLDSAIEEAEGNPNAPYPLAVAVAFEDQLDNPLEPPLWIFSSRERAGAWSLRHANFKGAAEMFRQDLARHPENGWSLFGLATALEALHDPEAPAIRKRFEKAWARSDFKLTPDLL